MASVMSSEAVFVTGSQSAVGLGSLSMMGMAEVWLGSESRVGLAVSSSSLNTVNKIHTGPAPALHAVQNSLEDLPQAGMP